MIQAVIFDLGGVLFTNGTKKFIEDISSTYGIDPEIVKDVMDGDVGSRYRESKITRDQFWNTVLEKLNISEDREKLENQWIGGYTLIEGTRDIIRDLAKKYSLYYLSDNVRERVKKINERYNFLGLFDDGVFSHDVGMRKPNPEIYRYLLDKIQVRPEETVFIDDKQSALEPAKKMGMETILFVNPDLLRQKLRELKIL